MPKISKNKPPTKRTVREYTPTGASSVDPVVPFQVWKIRVSTVEALRQEASENGWSTSGLVRKLLDDWAVARQAQRVGQSEESIFS
jgi:hypothetical protein